MAADNNEDLVGRLILALWVIAADVKELKAEIQSLNDAHNQVVEYEQGVIASLNGSATEAAQSGGSGESQVSE